jgi:hypothetical protein
MQPKYDIAISFLSADEPIAAALHNSLSVGLEVFFYPRRQEELAGTNGLESMRAPFLSESRIVVVLYRDPWGNTPWTRVEQAAIQDGCLKCGWQRLFFVMLDRASEPPLWLPNAHVRFNYADFGLEQAVGAIKARVQELGGTIAPVTALKRAELAKQETQYLKEKEQLRSPGGRETVRQKALELFNAIERLCAEINASKNATIQVAKDPPKCHLRNDRVSLFVSLADSYSYSESGLVVRQFNNKCAFSGERLFYPDGKPKKLSENRFLPEMNRARECGWVEDGEPSKFLSSETLADNIVGQFIDLAARADRGEFKVSLG